MKEFIEKLIGRLEEYKDSHLIEHDSEECLHCQENEDDWCNCRDCSICVWDKAVEIVNQLAEEYNQEHDDTDYANIELYAFWQKHQWIPCSEKKPRMIDAVLVCKKDGFMTVAIRGQAGKFCDTYANVLDDVIAWQPLPNPFKPIAE